MATSTVQLALQSRLLSYGIGESTKLVPAPTANRGKRVACRLSKLELGEMNFSGRSRKTDQEVSKRTHRLKALSASGISLIQTAKRVPTYLFRTDIGGHVKVLVEKTNGKYIVLVEVLPSEHSDAHAELVMLWGLFRSDASCFMPLDLNRRGADGQSSTLETPFVQGPSDKVTVELDFEASLAPFYISFYMKSQLVSDMKRSEIRSHRNTNFVVPVGLTSGHPSPLGLSCQPDGTMNFALFSRSAKSVVLCLYDDISVEMPSLEIDLDPYVNRSGDIWHAALDCSLSFKTYGYRCKVATSGKEELVLLDPYSKVIRSVIPRQGGSKLHPKYLGELCKEPGYDWSDDVPPSLPMEKLIVYRLNVTEFTKDGSSKLPDDLAGTFSGITEKWSHFKHLGVNAILLEPIFPFEEQKGPYFPSHFFSPGNMHGRSSDPLSVIKSMKDMVKKLHANGIEIFLEVIFTHTAEDAPLMHIDNSCYYSIKGGDMNIQFALNCNYPIVQQMILDCLRYWVIEFHIDGFVFVNASSLLKGFHGEILSRPQLVEAIAFDPILSKVKIIADYWDALANDSKEILFPHWRKWAEINTRFCDDIRDFLRGKGLLSSLATRLCGSGDIFSGGRGPAFSFNYIARNFGLTLVDLVSFSSSEVASELSWNCGEEGPTTNNIVLETRLKQVRNFLFILFISLGVPVLNMGDECGQSSGGSPVHGARKSFDWSTLKTGFGIQTTQFISFLTSLRMRRSDLLQKRTFLKEENIQWHGSDQSPPKWDDPSSRFLAMSLKADAEGSQTSVSDNGGDLFVAFNSAGESESVILPPPPTDVVWHRLVDTALPFPGFFAEKGTPVEDGLVAYEMKPHSCLLFEAQKLAEI
ncbi:isoamylase 2, chloroplastic [Nicotiana sylvestris]|uniref:Isoamylase 2, chloroplastic n=1 Tax=Nicotiana sylvestris TaxID=4096 RepID=A0A1U7VGJ2_NICSY|nr:PREDICTED: isoamylase 2, chloroplastic [Nicotiana sylvestris]XP_009761455.1 PREDICTED: isoamylase 2, chloroplastic [Nicotiana sylvestris]